MVNQLGKECLLLALPFLFFLFIIFNVCFVYVVGYFVVWVVIVVGYGVFL